MFRSRKPFPFSGKSSKRSTDRRRSEPIKKGRRDSLSAVLFFVLYPTRCRPFSKGPGKERPLWCSLQVDVKHHRNIAHEYPSERCQQNSVLLHLQKSVMGISFELFQFRGEITIEILPDNKFRTKKNPVREHRVYFQNTSK